ncbi:MAG: hypothetical protein ACTSPR_04315 [Candidatus Thorarchaeota archaeon]
MSKQDVTMMRSRNQSAEDLLGNVETTHHRNLPSILSRTLTHLKREVCGWAEFLGVCQLND